MNITSITAALACTLAAACTFSVENGDTDMEWGTIAGFDDEDFDFEDFDDFDVDFELDDFDAHKCDEFDFAFSAGEERPRPFDAHVSWEHGGVKRWASGKGTVRFAADDRSVESVTPSAEVWIGEDRDGTLREVYFLASDYGKPRVIYDVDRVEQAWDAEARAWFAELLPDVVVHAEVGARSRAARILRDEGASALLASFRELRTPAVRAHYVEALLEAEDLDPDELASALDACTGELARSGMQYSYYRRLAERFPESSRLQFALIACGERADLPSDRFDAQRALLAVWRKGALSDAALEQRWIEACELPEPKLHADLLLEYVAAGPAGDRSRIAALRAARELPSSVLRSSVIERCAKRSPATDELLFAVVEEITDLESAARREALLFEFLERDALSEAVLDSIGDAAKGLGSPAAEHRVLARLSVVRAAS
jgi:hypothetical protein